MNDADYSVITSREVVAQFKELSRRAKLQGRLPEFVDAAEWIMSELEQTPLIVGEARYPEDDKSAHMLFRVAYSGPLQVEYAVRDDVKMVFIRRFALRKA